MKIIKRILSIALIVALTVCLYGCGKKTEDISNDNSSNLKFGSRNVEIILSSELKLSN